MHLLKGIIKSLKLILSDIRSAIVAWAVGLLLASFGVGILYLYITAKDATIAIMTTPTPLWLTTLLVLACCAYISLKFRQLYLSHNTPNKTPSENSKILYRVIGNYKWKVEIYPSGHFKVDHLPFCAKHDKKFIFKDGKSCPDHDCKNNISTYDDYRVKAAAESDIEKELRNNDISAFTKY
jgi:hypothetical protein